ncbi:hypothetical protein PAAG_12677, partial [Paracoccidioides lutzii Pb01]
YHKLIIHNENNYHEFIIRFLYLISEVKIVKRNYNIDFNDKLFFDLQRMIAVVNAIINIYAKFQKICAQAIFNSQTLSDTSAIKFSIMKETMSICSDIQCYYCEKKDHIAKNCIMKQKSQ